MKRLKIMPTQDQNFRLSFHTFRIWLLKKCYYNKFHVVIESWCDRFIVTTMSVCLSGLEWSSGYEGST